MAEITNKKNIPSSGEEVRNAAREVLAVFRGTGWPIVKVREVLKEADSLLNYEPLHDSRPVYKLKLETDE